MRKLILTVCKGNIQRSVIAALAIQKQLLARALDSHYEVLSRGIQGMPGTIPPKFANLRLYENEWRFAGPALDELGLHLPESQRSMPVTSDAIERATVVLAMDEEVLKKLRELFPEANKKIILFGSLTGQPVNVEDPYGKGSADVYRSLTNFVHSTIVQHFGRLLSLCEEEK